MQVDSLCLVFVYLSRECGQLETILTPVSGSMRFIDSSVIIRFLLNCGCYSSKKDEKKDGNKKVTENEKKQITEDGKEVAEEEGKSYSKTRKACEVGRSKMTSRRNS